MNFWKNERMKHEPACCSQFSNKTNLAKNISLHTKRSGGKKQNKTSPHCKLLCLLIKQLLFGEASAHRESCQRGSKVRRWQIKPSLRDAVCPSDFPWAIVRAEKKKPMLLCILAVAECFDVGSLQTQHKSRSFKFKSRRLMEIKVAQQIGGGGTTIYIYFSVWLLSLW